MVVGFGLFEGEREEEALCTSTFGVVLHDLGCVNRPKRRLSPFGLVVPDCMDFSSMKRGVYFEMFV